MACVVERTLLEMGFNEEMVARAVQLTDGDADQSVALGFGSGALIASGSKKAAGPDRLPAGRRSDDSAVEDGLDAECEIVMLS